MVLFEENPKKRPASCWSLLVVYGGGGSLLTSFLSTAETTKGDLISAMVSCASLSVDMLVLVTVYFPSNRSKLTTSSYFLSPFFISSASNALNSPNTLQNSSFLNFSISLSRSTISRTVTDCTRPADNQRFRSLFQRR